MLCFNELSPSVSARQVLRRSILATAISVSLSGPLQAAMIPVDGSTCSLIDAITSANTDTAVGGCVTGGAGGDTLTLLDSSVHTLESVNNSMSGTNGLPLITSTVTIEGNGATIERGGTNPPPFRLFDVAAGGNLTLNNLSLTNGRAGGSGAYSGSGGAILVRSGAGLNVSNSTISGNTAWQGGGIHCNDLGLVELVDTIVSGNTVTGAGGGLNGDSFCGVSLIRTTVSGNTAQTGGAIYGFNISLTMGDTKIINNIGVPAIFLGNAYTSGQPLHISHSTISGNSGHGIMAFKQYVRIEGSTISGNAGDGIYINSPTERVILQTITISGNTGIGLASSAALSVTLDDSTLFANNGGGVFTSGSLTMHNSIIAGSTGGNDCSGPGVIVDGGNNWSGDDSCNGIARGAPMLLPLTDNGGQTRTHALMEGSGVIDAGNIASCGGVDQRGVTRPQGAGCDIGALEYVPPILVDGIACTLVQAINSANGDMPVGSCTQGNPTGADTLVLENSSVHYIVAVNNSNSGDNGLPLIHSSIVIEGNDSQIERVSAAPFRLFEVASEGSLTLNDMLVSEGLASGTTGPASFGGAFLNRGALTFNNSGIMGSHAAQGGAIFNQGVDAQVSLYNATISGNSVTGNGGGLYNQGVAHLDQVTIRSNYAAMGDGGGIYANTLSTTHVIDSTFSQNEAKNGGAIFSHESTAFSLKNSTVTSNDASQTGGGLAVSSAVVDVINSTFMANYAAVSGGGLHGVLAADIELLNCTISENRSPLGAGIYADSGILTVGNSIVANSYNGSDCTISGSSFVEVGNNWFGDSSCNGSSQGDPLLNQLEDNGGPTQTIALLAGSGAIDAADPAVCADSRVANLDQRGESRTEDDQCDIGAFERRDDGGEGDFIVIPLPGGKTAVIPL